MTDKRRYTGPDRRQEPMIRVPASEFARLQEFEQVTHHSLHDIRNLILEIERKIANVWAKVSSQMVPSLPSAGDGAEELDVDTDETTDPIRKYIIEVSEDDCRRIKMIHKGTKLSARLVSEITNPDRKLHLERHNIVELVTEVAFFLEPDNGGSKVSISASSDLEEVVVDLDEIGFWRLLHNLVLNSRQAIMGQADRTEPGQITITVNDKVEHVEIIVEDNGPGIDIPEPERIFDDGFSTKKGQGRGMGLANVRKIVEQHKGKISVDTRVGEESFTRFKISLPKKGEVREEALLELLNGYTLVAIDDDPHGIALYEIMAERTGIKNVVEFGSYEEFVARGLDNMDTNILILLDNSLPGAHGSEVAAELREKMPNAVIALVAGILLPAFNELLEQGHVDAVMEKGLNSGQAGSPESWAQVIKDKITG